MFRVKSVVAVKATTDLAYACKELELIFTRKGAAIKESVDAELRKCKPSYLKVSNLWSNKEIKFFNNRQSTLITKSQRGIVIFIDPSLAGIKVKISTKKDWNTVANG